jgi:hypothetical protein
VTLLNHTKSSCNNDNDDNAMCASVWFNSLVDCFNIKTCGMWKGNVTSSMQIVIENVCSLGFWDIRGGISLRRMILWRLWCNVL